MLVHPDWSPTIVEFGPIAVRWYGLMYVIAFGLFYLLGRYRLSKPLFARQSGLDARSLEDLLTWGVVGVVLGGRLGYILFYKPDHYLAYPLDILKIWTGGMSFHGGLLGVIVALLLYCRSRNKPFWPVIDFVAPLVPLGLAAGRMGNFINAELWGRPTDVSWGMVFPRVDELVRHPSQLYQFAGEGVALFLILWWYTSKPRPAKAASGVFLIGYAVFRFLAEFTREPDSYLGFLAFGATMGQLLSIPMFLFGCWLLTRSYKEKDGI